MYSYAVVPGQFESQELIEVSMDETASYRFCGQDFIGLGSIFGGDGQSIDFEEWVNEVVVLNEGHLLLTDKKCYVIQDLKVTEQNLQVDARSIVVSGDTIVSFSDSQINSYIISDGQLQQIAQRMIQIPTITQVSCLQDGNLCLVS